MTETVAVLGAGRMGGAMIGTLRRSGFGVIAWNRDRDKADEVAQRTGASLAATAIEAVAAADVVISSLADDAAVLNVYEAISGRVPADAVALEMSTIAPGTVRAVAPWVTGSGAAFLDAPVSGSVSTVESGQLTIMVGGDPAALERTRPALEALSSKIIHVGELGTGAAMKLSVNALVHGLNAALSESLVLAGPTSSGRPRTRSSRPGPPARHSCTTSATRTSGRMRPRSHSRSISSRRTSS